MTLRHLRIFREAAVTGNFTRAAENLYLTQSAVSHAIGELEKEAGTQLFERQSRTICLTRSGELLLEETIPVLTACEGLERKMKGLEIRAVLHVVSSITIAIYYLPAMIQEFGRRWPDTRVETEVVSAAQAMDRLRSGEADIALVEGMEPEEPYCSRLFSECRLKAVCAPGYPAAGSKLSLAAFCGENLLLRERGSAIRDLLDSALYLEGHQVHPLWSSVNSTALLSAAKAGIGIAVVPDMLADEEIAKGTLSEVRIKGVKLINPMRAVWHKDKYVSAPLRTFMELADAVKEERADGTDYISY